MFCKSCGMELEEGALFCSACGAQAEPEKEDVTDKSAADGEKQRFCPNCGCENDETDIFCRECGMSLVVAVQGAERKKVRSAADKKVLMKWIAMGAACLAALALVLWGVTHLMAGTSSGSAFVIYDKENELTAARKSKFVPTVVGDKIQANEDDNGNGYGIYEDNYIRYSESGEYLYYPQKGEDGEFDLYRKNLKKKKDEGTKLASKIRDYVLIDDDNFVYVKDSEKFKLYLYHKGESEKIGSDVGWFRVSENGKYILWIADGDLYVQAAKVKAETKKLDTNVTRMYGFSDDLRTIVYQKDTDLYIMKDMKEAERIAKEVEGAYACDMNGGGKIYYVQSEDADSSALRGEGLTGDTPAAAASETAAPVAEALAAEEESSSEWEDHFNPADYASEELTYYDLITDDLLAQDQEIREPAYEDYETSVYRGDEVDYEFDQQAYDEANQLYQAKRTRDELRRRLASTPVDMDRWEVYYYEGGKKESSQVCEVHLLSDMGIYGNLMQNEALLFVGDVPMEQVETSPFSELAEVDDWEAQEKLLRRLRENAKLLCLRNGQVSEVMQTGEEGNCNSVYANEDQHIVYLGYQADERRILYRYDYTAKGAVPELVSDEVKYVVSAEMDKLCYVDEDDVLFYGEQEVGEDVGSFKACDDKKILYLMDQEDSEGTLMLFEGGESSVEIAENVLEGSYGLFDGEHAACLTDYSFRKEKGDMCVFMGKKAQIIDTDVSRIYFPRKEPDRGE